ncbi:MAG: hypothetical protein JSS27_13700 [Planctomycetes bacterium]|nr:hypothetical protein [Planctomycetota bacterium]
MSKAILAVLGINVVVTLLAVSALFSFVFLDDPILSAVPVVWASIGILLQPWFILFFLWLGAFLAPFATTAVTVLVYGSLYRTGKLGWIQRRLKSIGWRRVGVFASVLGVLSVAVVYARYIDFPSLRAGVPSSIEYRLTGAKLTLDESRYYCLGRFIDSEWLWQARLPAAEFNQLVETLQLKPIEGDLAAPTFRQMPPYWWKPRITPETKVLATTGFPIEKRGPDGWHAIAVWNADDHLLYLWVKDNF